MPTLRTVYPDQVEGYLPNPYMGWQDTQTTGKRFVETVGYRRMNWNILNPGDGVYDWSPIEALRSDMQDEAISFRIRTAVPPPWGPGQAMPDWLVERGAKIVEGDTDEEGGTSTEPYYAGCLFLAAHARFVDALRQRYDGDPDVAYIDIGSYGTYGEWDSAQYDAQPGSLDWHARRRLIDMYLGGQGTRPCEENDGRIVQIVQVAYNYVGFHKTRLVMPYTPWFSDSVVYAASRRQDVGIRHDALGSETHQNKFREEIGGLVQQTWPTAPIVFEFASYAYTPEALQSGAAFAREMHATFVHDNFSGSGSGELIEKVLAGVGYRLMLRRMAYSSELRPGQTLSFEMDWENTGVAPPYFKTYPLVLSLANATGTAVQTQRLDPDIRTWQPGKLIQLQGTMQLAGNIPAGDYNLRLAFVDPASGQPVLTLTITGRDTQGRYVIGPVKVSP